MSTEATMAYRSALISRTWGVPTKVEYGGVYIDTSRMRVNLEDFIQVEANNDSIQIHTIARRSVATIRMDALHNEFDIKFTVIAQDSHLYDTFGHHVITNVILKKVLMFFGANPNNIPRGCAPVRTSRDAVSYTLPADDIFEHLLSVTQNSDSTFEFHLGRSWTGRGTYDTSANPTVTGFIDPEGTQKRLFNDPMRWHDSWISAVQDGAREAYTDIRAMCGDKYKLIAPLFEYKQLEPNWASRVDYSMTPIDYTADILFKTNNSTFYAQYAPSHELPNGYILVNVLDDGLRVAAVLSNWIIVPASSVSPKLVTETVTSATGIVSIALEDISVPMI